MKNNIYTELKKEHDLLRNLMGKILKTTDKDLVERKKLFEEFKNQLLSHSIAEEQTLYAELSNHSNTKKQVKHGLAEHKETEGLLKELSVDIDDNNNKWLSKFEELSEELDHHIEEEEEDLFDLAKENLSENEEQELEHKFKKSKQKIKNAL